MRVVIVAAALVVSLGTLAPAVATDVGAAGGADAAVAGSGLVDVDPTVGQMDNETMGDNETMTEEDSMDDDSMTEEDSMDDDSMTEDDSMEDESMDDDSMTEEDSMDGDATDDAEAGGLGPTTLGLLVGGLALVGGVGYLVLRG